MRSFGETKFKIIKEDLIKRSLDIFNSGLTEEQRKKLLMIDRKALEKYMVKRAVKGINRLIL